MERYSNSIREVGQAGRRGALMITLSVHHPEISDFIKVKNDLTKVTGANISVKLTNEFLNAVKENEEYEQRWPLVNPTITKNVKAKKVWKEIIHNAWKMAEPGLLFWDNIIDESPADCYVSQGYQTTCVNPCCFAESQEVHVKTLSGYKEIKSVTSEDLVWEPIGAKWVKTNGYFYVGIYPTVCITFSNGIGWYVTENHKVAKLANFGIFNLIEVKDLKHGDDIVCDSGGMTKVISIEPRSNGERVGCIEVPEYNYFIADGIISGNSEIPLSPLDSCRLLFLNLFSYVQNPFTDNAYFDYKLFYEHAQIAQRLMDDIIDIELEQIQKILDKIKADPEPNDIKSPEISLWTRIKEACQNGRRTGTGITGLGDCLAALGIKYGSKASIEATGRVYRVLKFGCYRSSIDMAKELGSFPVWDPKLEKENPFLQRILGECIDFTTPNSNPEVCNALKPVFGKELYNDMQKYGRRNIALLTTAPVGTGSTQTQTTSGIEPLFQTSYKRRKKINPHDKNTRVDFTDQNGDKWQEFEILHSKISLWQQITRKSKIEESPWYGACADDLDWKQRVKLQAVAQKHIDHAISSTINLPEDVFEEKVGEIYQTAWEEGLKGITVYRKNCRSGVLIDSKPEKKVDAPKRPQSLPCDIYHFTSGHSEWFICVGKLNNNPYEILAGNNLQHTEDEDHIKRVVSKRYKEGIVTKKKRGVYELSHDEVSICDNIVSRCSDEEEIFTRQLSVSLRHGVPVQYVIEQVEKAKGNLSSFAKCVARVLKKYVPDGTKISGQNCPECNGELTRAEGCYCCVSCGYSKC
jgi:ribonucleotide reductase alpha subunit